MGKRKTTLMAFLLSATLPVCADDNVTVVTSAGETPYPMESISRIDFSDAGITVVASSGDEVTYAFDEIRKIVFSTTPTGIEPMTTVRKSKLMLTVTDGGRSVRINGWGDRGAASLEIYGLNGGKEVNVSGWDGSVVDVSSLSHGIYILKVGSETAKFRK